jgi:hypothetical protein
MLPLSIHYPSTNITVSSISRPKKRKGDFQASLEETRVRTVVELRVMNESVSLWDE